MDKILWICSILTFVVTCEGKAWTDEEETPEYWQNLAKEELQAAIKVEEPNKKKAKNVILFLGDGMSVATITAGRIMKGQLQDKSGEETVLAMDKFHHAGLSKTYSVDRQVADSASTATAYLCGVKAMFYTLGLSGQARKDVCGSEKGNQVKSVLVDAYEDGKATGIVTTTRINHATPAGAYAHTASRKWYGDAQLSEDARKNGCRDIAQQFFDSSHMITVAMGGGRKYFQPNTTFDPEYSTEANTRLDGQDLISKWKQKQVENGQNAKYIWNKEQFDLVNPEKTDRLLGLFQPSDMQYEAERESDKAGEPSLAEMTQKSIEILRKNSNGYFLLVEGGRIDHGHHGNHVYKALRDTVAFDDAIEKAVQMTSDDDTLIIVTADHSHTFNLGGYTDRGTPIWGLVQWNGEVQLAHDGKPYTSVSYGNGEGYQGTGTYDEMGPHHRENLTGVATGDLNYRHQTSVPLKSESHGGDDVIILARGPMSHLFHGVHQQSYIAYAMRYAACIGSVRGHCEENPEGTSYQTNNFLGMELGRAQTSTALNVQFALLIILFTCVIIMGILLHKKNSRRGYIAQQQCEDGRQL
ncbi:unnamed protein product [Clavelina lepadiformis]|uniref:Alkaline phosphatase n=2 Tax=Clavelina lepadiformis TaxID=159417 RepID=A0ABP0H3Q4_CLALP